MPASSLITSQLHTFITLIPIQRTHTHRCYCTQTTPQPNLGLSKHANEASWADQGSLQCALMINNPVGISVAHITTKHNVIADRISRIKRKTNTIPEFSSRLSPAEILQTFSPKQRANLTDYGYIIAKEHNRSSCSKQATTVRSRQDFYIKFTKRIGISDPCMATLGVEARNYFLACYAVSLVQGETFTSNCNQLLNGSI